MFKALRVIVCISIISLVFYLYLPPVENRMDIMNATVGKDRVDILCIGSSHMFCGINPAKMYRDQGFATYILAAGAQSPCQSYYYLKQACRTQKPIVVLMDVYMMGSVQDIHEYQDNQTVNNLLNFPLSVEKINAVENSMADSRLSILLRFPYIYKHYDDFRGFTISKFVGYEDYSMGYQLRSDIAICPDVIDICNVMDESELSMYNNDYLLKIIDYCQDNEIKLILVNSPSPKINAETQKYYNRIGSIAAEYSVGFIDGNRLWDEIGIDWACDSSDGGHMNHYGVNKFTKYIEDYIRNNYGGIIPDRRTDERYNAYSEGIVWQDNLIGGM